MPKLIKCWKDLEGLESENYKIRLEYLSGDTEPSSGWIVPKVETKETDDDYWKHHVYLSTHTFYGSEYKKSTETFQKYGFDIEIDNWDKDNPNFPHYLAEESYPLVKFGNSKSNRKKEKSRLTTNMRKILEFREKAHIQDISDKTIKAYIRTAGGDVDKAVEVFYNKEGIINDNN